MGITELLDVLRERGIVVSLRDGRLTTAAPKGAITEEIATLIRTHRDALVGFLQRVEAQSGGRARRIERAPEAAAYPLSFSQQRLWFIDRLHGSTQYNIPIAFRLVGDVDEGVLGQALDALVARHATLRTRFGERDGMPVQIVEPARSVALAHVDLSDAAEDEQERRLALLVVEEADRPFDLSCDLMLRCTLVRIAPQVRVVLFTMHHIASDGWSMGVLVREFAALYEAAVAGHGDPLPPLAIQYADFAAWQRGSEGVHAMETSLAYWTEKLRDLPAVHALPLDKPRPARQRFVADRCTSRIDASVLHSLHGFARERGATLFMVLQAALATLLSRWSGETDIVLGAPIAGREQAEVAPLIGFFINTLVFRTDLSADPRLDELVERVRDDALEAYSHQHVPFDLLVETLRPERDLAYNPICQVKFVLQNHQTEALSLPGLRLEPLGARMERVRFDLDLTASESPDGLHLSWTYREDLFEPATIERMAAAFGRVLSAMAEQPQLRVSELPWVDGEAQATLLSQGTGPVSSAGRAVPLVSQVASQAHRTPSAVAVRCGDASLTYAQLDAASNRLAHALAEQGVEAGARVGVQLERSPELLVALLAVMKTGAAYVMLDPKQAPARLQAIVADAGIAVVVQAQAVGRGLAGVDALYVDDAEALIAYPSTPPGVEVDLHSSAYVLYTSGSTGVPKGVEVTHAGLVDYCAFALGGYYADHLAGSLVATSPAFDLTIPALYVPLLAGGCVELVPVEDELAALASRLDGEVGAVLLRLTPSHVQGLLALTDARPRPQAHVFVVGGEAFPVALAQALQGKYPNARVINHYGPTETVVGCCWYDVSANLASLSQATSLPIGVPMENTRLYVLDAQGRLVPPGVAGELYIGGAGVAKGYLGRAELTAEKFVADPFEAGGRLYRSGDRVRWRNDGQLEFLGRLDAQVKLRGFRIEPGEIESRLRSHASVREAAVRVRGEGAQARLVAYVVAQADTTAAADTADAHTALIDALKAHAADGLPAYMQPQAYVVLERLPLTVNGKLDVAALPEPDVQAGGYVAPRTPTEVALAAIWSQVLGREAVGAEDNFFALGGHSLLATRVVSAIARQLDRQVPVRALFEQPVLSQLARWLDGQARQAHAPIPVVDRDGPLPLSFAQQRLWFIDRLEGGSAQYNMPVALRLDGALDVPALQSALDALVARHEVLRTVYAEVDGAAVQVIRPASPVAIAFEDLGALPAAAQAGAVQARVRAEAARPFDLAHDAMLRVSLLRLGEAAHALLLTLHHIASDGWSIGVLVREAMALYAAQVHRQAAALPPLPVQYADYAAWQRARLSGARLEASLDYWRTQLAVLPAVHGLPLDRPRPAQQRFEGAHVEVAVDATVLAGLQALAQRRDATLFMVLHAALSVLLSRWSGETDIVVGTPIAGRVHADVEGLIGFFVNTLVLRADLSGDPAFATVLEQVRETALAAYAHQEVPFELLVDALKPSRSLAHAPLFQILLSLRNNEQVALSLPELAVASLGDGYEQAKFDLQLAATETPDGLRLSWTYATSLFEAATVQRLAGAFARLLAAVAEKDDVAVGAIGLDDGENARLFELACGPENSGGRDTALPTLIAEEARRAPHAVAVRMGPIALTYAQLEARSNRLAHALRAHGIEAGSHVGVNAERSPSLIVALLAVMKTGAVYVPLDPRQPSERLASIVDDARIAMVLWPENAIASAPTVASLPLDAAADAEWLSAYPSTPVAVEVDLQSSAYVLYTSGSTGVPKGVEVTHAGLVDYCAFARGGYYAEHLAGSLVATSPAFDLTIPALYVPLLAGGCVELVPVEDELAALAARLDGEVGSVLLRLTPSHVQGLLALSDARPRAQAHVFVVGGEAFPVALAQALQGKYPDARVINHYGPTETVVGCCWYDVSAHLASLAQATSLPIGVPMENTRLYVLDGRGRLVPPGVAGELYIGGAGVAKGYLGRAELTAEKFVADPFEAGGRLYRSGDRVRWRNDGQLEFLGRLDAQVKLRGFRIEPGEIESRLRSHAQVREAAVRVRGEGAQARLVAYVVAAGEGDDGLIDALKAHAADTLPAYMQPQAYVVLERLPLTVNGKLDVAALPEPDVQAGGYVAPRTPTEVALAAIWSQVLGREAVGAEDNFFEIGGDSILSIQVVTRANQAGIAITTRQLFEAQTIAALAARAAGTSAPIAPQDPVDGDVRPLPIQNAFLEDATGPRHHYNQAVLLDLPFGTGIDTVRLLVDALYLRHDALRLRFVEDGGHWRGEHVPYDDAVRQAATIDERQPAGVGFDAWTTERCTHWQGAFDLATGPLFRAVHLQGDVASRLFLVAHHIVIDGVSWRILLSDLEQGYRQLQRGETLALPPKTASFQQWCDALAAHADDDALESERAYWIAQAAVAAPALPTDRPAADCGTVDSSANVGFDLSPDDTTRLLQACNRAYRTQINELLLSALYIGARRWAGVPALRIALEGHGRASLFDSLDVTQTVGWFTTVHPLTLSADTDEPGIVVQRIKEQYRAVPNDGIGHGLLRHLRQDAELCALEAGQRPAIAFNYLGQAEQVVNDASFFRIADVPAGPTAAAERMRRHPLVLKGLVTGGCLRFTLEYSRAHYDEDTMRRFGEAISGALREIVEHCATRTTTQWTPSDFPLARVDAAQVAGWQATYPAMRDLYAATPMQTGLYFHTQLDPTAYVTQTFPVLEGALDARAFRAAWEGVVARHDVFRTAFVGEGEQLHQLVVAQAALPWHEEDWRALDAAEQERRFEDYRDRDRARGFDFRQPPLMRIALFRLGDARYRLLWTHHHMLSDGWSLPLIYRDVMALYQAATADAMPALADAPRYVDYIRWLDRQDRAAATDFWRGELGAIEAPTPLGIDRLPADGDFGQRECARTLDEATSERLQALARRQRLTVNTLVQFAWGYLLHRYSGEKDVVFGATIAGRPAEVPGIEAMVGLFINSIPVRLSFDHATTVGEALAGLQARFQQAGEYGYLALPEIQRQSALAPGARLFDSLLVIGNYPIEAAMQAQSGASGLRVVETGRSEKTGYKLAFNVGLRGRVHLQCTYAAEEFARAGIERLLEHFEHVLRQLPDALDAPVASLEVFTPAEADAHRQWNAVPHAYPRDRCVHELVEQRAAQCPEAIAATFDDESCTYGELNREANRVAHWLRGQGVGPDTLVGLCVERSIDMLVGMLGILKAGGAYLPLDADYPEDRLAYMLDDAGVEVVLTQSGILQALDVFAERTVLPLDAALRAAFLAGQPDTNLPVGETGVGPRNLAYAIYTSGSTGQPKGVLVEHLNVVRLVCAPDYVELAPGGVMAQASNCAFDAATFEIWGALANGMRLQLVDKATLLDPARLTRALHERGVTTMFVTTAVFNQMSIVDDAGFGSLDWLLFGGEGVDVEAVGRVLAGTPPRHLVHVYGPTENTSFSTAYEIVAPRADTYPIGRPIAGTVQYVLDAQGRDVPCGAVGELHLGGDGLGRGYLRRPALDAERFVAHRDTGERLYRTGDLVRRTLDGDIVFVGRADDQVKIRGFRVELGEIETFLLAHPAAQDAVVVVRRDGGAPRLVAYATCPAADELPNATLLAKEWRAFLKQRLPEHMVPAAFVVMDALPLNRNGKVDRQALPEPDYQSQIGYIAPETPVQAQLASIWQQVLRVDQVGIHDNFFEIGGDSILSIQVVSRANQAGIAISTKQLFEAQTVAELAACAGSQPEVRAPQAAVMGPLPLLPVHHLFFDGDSTDRHHFNQAVLLETPAHFDPKALQAVLAALYDRHDALRLRFVEGADGWTAEHVAPDPAHVLDSCVIEAMPADEADAARFLAQRCSEWQNRFDLARGPLLRAVYFRPSATGRAGRLFIGVHHIVFDGVSWRVLLADLEQAYRQYAANGVIALAPKTSSFQQWAQALADHAASEAILAERDFWLRQCTQPIAALPVDRPARDPGPIASTRTVAITLSPDDTRALQQQCPSAYRTQVNELLLAGVYLGMRRWTGHEGVRLRLEGHGREALDDTLDLTGTVGWFTSVYPLTLHCTGDDVGAVIKSVKEHYRAIPCNGLGYGVLRYLTRDPAIVEAAPDASDALLFNYLGQFDQVLNGDTAFQPARESAGPQVSLARRRSARLTLSGKVFEGSLQFTLGYSSEHYDDATMQALAQGLENGWRDVIRHCLSSGAGGFTPSDFPLAHVEQSQLDAWHARYPRLTRLYPAAPMQAGLLFHAMQDRASYVIHTFPILCGELDVAKFRAAWDHVVARHDVFRTAFVGEGHALQQLVVASATLPWHEEDWRGLDTDAQQARFAAYRREDKAAGFDFTAPPLMRMALFRLADDRYQLLWSFHHVVLDGWSIPLVYKDVVQHYQALLAGEAPAMPRVPAYERYIAWLAERPDDVARAYWRATIGDIEAPTPLGIDRLPRDDAEGYHERAVQLTADETAALVALAQARRTTVNTLVQWAWGFLLHRYSGEQDVVFGATISGRPAQVQGIEEMVGLFINSIPVRLNIDDGATVGESIATLHRGFQDGTEYGYLSLADIQRQSRVPPRTPLFDSLLVFENFPLDAVMDAASRPSQLRVEKTARISEQTNYKLNLIGVLQGNLQIKCGYHAEDFAASVIDRMLGHLARVLVLLPDAIDAPPAAIGLVTSEEHEQLLGWAGTPAPAAGPLVHELVQARAAEHSEAVALRFGKRTLTYGELNARSNRVAHYLMEQGVGPDVLVGLCVERSIEMVVGALAVLKAGGAYVPLDPDYPDERLAFMIEDADVPVLLTSTELLEAHPAFLERTVLPLDASMHDALVGAFPDGDPPRRATSSSLAYVTYTSGSTGMPKGVMVEHAGVTRLVQAPNYVRLEPGARMAQASNGVFDAATFELWGALANGMQLVHVPKECMLDPERLAETLVRDAIDVLFVTTAVFNQMSLVRPDGFAALDCLLFGGEAVDRMAVARVLRAGKPRRLMHVYGPTENTTFSTAYEIVDERGTYPIGRPIRGSTQYVVDGAGGLVPPGVVGELYVGGAGVARGYLRRPELTAERFVPDPWCEGGRLYRTGDLVRWLPEGEVEFVGRVDDQVKLRGFRVEPGEIAGRINGVDGVRESVVVVQGEGAGRRLVAYVVADGEVDDSFADTLRRELRRQLPDYMVPAAFVRIDAIPLTVNGKVDRRALPDPQQDAPRAARVAPATSSEARLADIWAGLLEVADVDVTHDFFDLGGHSLLVMRLVMEIRSQFDVDIAVKEIFERPSVRALAARLDEMTMERALKASLAFDGTVGDSQELIEL